MTNSTSYTCFKKSEFSLYLFLITCIFVYLLYILYYKHKEQKNEEQHEKKDSLSIPLLNEINLKMQKLQDELLQTKINKNYQQQQQQQQQRYQQNQQQQQVLLDRIYNPLVSPERTYPGGRLYSKQYDDYQQIGFIFNNQERFPLYGRPKYPGKSDKFEYYIIDETRNHLKIPFASKNDNEIYDGDDIFVDVFNNSFTVKIYNYDNLRYNPNVL